MQPDSVPKKIKLDDTLYNESILVIKLIGIHSESASYFLSVSIDIPQYSAAFTDVYPLNSLAARNVI